jgi:hypothetical protein
MATPLAAEEALPRILRMGVRPSAAAKVEAAESRIDAGMTVARQRELEPNDESAQTNAIACAGSENSTAPSAVVLEYDGGMRDRIEDLYVLDVPHAANLTLELTYPNPAADFDLFLMALDGEKELKVVAASNFHAPGRPERITIQVWPGRYYAGVSAVQGSSTYALTLSAPGFLTTSNEIAAKALNVCGNANRSWVFAEEPTNLKATVTVTDTVTDTTREYAIPTETDYETITGEAAFGTIESTSSTPRRRAVGKPAPCTFAVSPLTQTITSSASTGTVDVTSGEGCPWTASSNGTWLTITSGKTGTGTGTVAYSFTANTSTSSTRATTLSVAGKTVSITQSAACGFTVSPTSKDFTPAGGTGTITVTPTRSDCAWTASVSTTATWITITAGQSGLGNGTVSYSVAVNSSTSSRSGSMTVAGRTVTITQAPDISSCTYSTEYTSKSITWCGGERTLGVTTQGSCPWTASSNASWLTIVLSSQTGTTDLSYSVATNTTGSSRQATITVAGKAVTITQSSRSGGGTYDGNWTGTTNGGRAVALCVADGAIQNASISVRLEFPTFYCTTPLIRQQSLPFTGSTFSGTFTTYPEVSNVFTTVRGTFTSATAVNGSWDPFSDSFFIICGSTFAFGTGGTILPSGTFTATKQP